MTSTLLLIRAGVARAALYVLLIAAAWVGHLGLTLPADVPVPDRGQVGTLAYAGPLDETPGRNIFRADAPLDASTIDDQHADVPAWAEILLVPTGTPIETTPMVPVPDTAYVVPEESPDGGHVLRPSAWLDNSPLYSDGWLLVVDNERDTVAWRAPQDEADRYGTGGGAVCGTDAQCRAWDHDHGITDHDLPCSPSDQHDAARCATTVQTVTHTTATDRPARLSRQCVKAARDVLAASLSRHLRVLEDLSYRGMSRRVGQCNDVLADAYYASGRDFTGRHDHRALRTFLRTVIRTGELPA